MCTAAIALATTLLVRACAMAGSAAVPDTTLDRRGRLQRDSGEDLAIAGRMWL